MSHRYNLYEIQSLVNKLESDSQFIKYTNPSESYKMSMAAQVIEQLMYEPLHSIEEDPPFKLGDEDYTGYLVIANGFYEIADYTCEDKYAVESLHPEFHVDGEYEPGVTHWMCLPKMPKDSDK